MNLRHIDTNYIDKYPITDNHQTSQNKGILGCNSIDTSPHEIWEIKRPDNR